ncbi:MAG: fasciclin domain-containing protein [Planctomycetota bacterium]
MARSSLSLVVFALAAAVPLGHWMARPAAAAARGTVVDVAVADPRFSTLVAAVKAAGLVETLSGPGPFTVLAPTDEAFRALPAGTVESLLKPENVSQLAAILSYHVLPGRVTAADLARGTPMKTVLGPTVTARFDGGRLLLGSAPVLATDVDASNGVVHVIGAVLLPPAAPATAPAGRLARAVGVVERALDVGVPLYNGGNHAACAAAYELAALSVATLADDVVPADVRDALLAAVASRAAPVDRAWTLRAALDRVLALATPRTGAAAPPPRPRPRARRPPRPSPRRRSCSTAPGSRRRSSGRPPPSTRVTAPAPSPSSTTRSAASATTRAPAPASPPRRPPPPRAR